MTTRDFTMTLWTDQTPSVAFLAINNVRGWWSKAIEGNTRQLHDEFVYRYKDLHYSRQKLIELIPDRKVVWLVTDSSLSFLNHKNEWTDTRISFDIREEEGKTRVQFTHWGLVPESECFGACSNGWGHYLQESLLNLINSGQGQPD